MNLKHVILFGFAFIIGSVNGDGQVKGKESAPGRLQRSADAWSEWSAWSDCSATCGVGSQIRKRECCGEESADTRVCDGDSEQSRRCASDACDPGDTDAAVETLSGNFARLHCRVAKEDDSAIHWLTPAGEDITAHSKTEKYDMEGGYLYVVHATSRDEGVYHCVVVGEDGRPHSADAPLVVRTCEKGNPCLNGGACVEMTVNDGLHQFTCACSGGYGGDFCQNSRLSGGMIALIVICILLFLCVAAMATHLVCARYKPLKKSKSGKRLPPPDDLPPPKSSKMSGMLEEYMLAQPSTAGATYGTSDNPRTSEDRGDDSCQPMNMSPDRTKTPESEEHTYANVPVHNLERLYSLQRAVSSDHNALKPASKSPSITVRPLSQSEFQQKPESSSEQMAAGVYVPMSQEEPKYDPPWDAKGLPHDTPMDNSDTLYMTAGSSPSQSPFILHESLAEDREDDEIYVSEKYVKLRAPSYVFTQGEQSCENPGSEDLYSTPFGSKMGSPIIGSPLKTSTLRNSVDVNTLDNQLVAPQFSPVKQRWGINVHYEKVLPGIETTQLWGNDRMVSDEQLSPFDIQSNSNNNQGPAVVSNASEINDQQSQTVNSNNKRRSQVNHDKYTENKPNMDINKELEGNSINRSICFERPNINRNSNNSSEESDDTDLNESVALLDKPLCELLAEPQLERFLKGIDCKKSK